MTGRRGIFIAILLAWAGLAQTQVQAQTQTQTQNPVEAEAGAAVIGVIQSQMAAFLRDDGAAAFAHAAPGIQRIFQTPDIFMTMVRGGYAPVYRPREVEFLPPRAEGADIVQPVRVTGPDGESVIALYRMQRQPDGAWKIAGVVLVRTGERSS